MKTAKGKDNGCGTRRWAGNFRPAPTVGVGGESDPIKTMRHWLGRVFVGGQATHGLPLQRCSYAMIWMMGVYGGGGRGNLRENREAPAPTVGVGGDVYPIKNDAALVGRALATFGSAPTKSATAKLDSAPLRFRLTLTS